MRACKNHIDQLVKRISQYDDEAAFEELFNTYFSWLKSVSMTIVSTKEDSEEIIEDVFVKLWSMRRDLTKIDNIETYLYVATKNKAYNYRNKYYKGYLVELQFESKEQSFSISPEETYIVNELKKRIDLAVSHLPIKCREVFSAVKQEGKSYKEAAKILNISPKTVENQLAIGIKRIKLEIDGYLNETVSRDLKELILLALLIPMTFF